MSNFEEVVGIIDSIVKVFYLNYTVDKKNAYVNDACYTIAISDISKPTIGVIDNFETMIIVQIKRFYKNKSKIKIVENVFDKTIITSDLIINITCEFPTHVNVCIHEIDHEENKDIETLDYYVYCNETYIGGGIANMDHVMNHYDLNKDIH